jgi:hypothetical protein
MGGGTMDRDTLLVRASLATARQRYRIVNPSKTA